MPSIKNCATSALGCARRMALLGLISSIALLTDGCATISHAMFCRKRMPARPTSRDFTISVSGATHRRPPLKRSDGGFAQDASQSLPVSNLLAISGGAEDGAFGAGLLVGWSDAGTRPTFDLVTGISSGALIAPFVFLGVNVTVNCERSSRSTEEKTFTPITYMV